MRGAVSRPDPDCGNGDCPCPNPLPGSTETCARFDGAAYCRFEVTGAKTQYRAVGCVSSPALNPTSSPTCVEAR
jgi:hypothetical protein